MPVLYATFVNSGAWPHGRSLAELKHAVPNVLRLIFFAAMVGILTPLQLEYGIVDEPRLLFFGVGPHVMTQTWAITSQLVLPLTDASPIDLLIRDIPTVQWVAGALAIAGGALGLVFGSRWLKLLVIWTALAIAPFTLWDLNYTSPRYVYMAAVPFSIILAWGAGEIVRFVVHVLHFRPIQALALAGTAAGIALACVISWQTVQQRDATWTAETAKYQPLADNLKLALKDPPKNGGRLVIYYGYWPRLLGLSRRAHRLRRQEALRGQRPRQGRGHQLPAPTPQRRRPVLPARPLRADGPCIVVDALRRSV